MQSHTALAALVLVALCVSGTLALEPVPRKTVGRYQALGDADPLPEPQAPPHIDRGTPSSAPHSGAAPPAAAPPASFVTMCRSHPTRKTHHKFLRLNTDCFQILFDNGMNPFTGELLGEATQTYAKAGCPYAGDSELHMLWRRFLFTMTAVPGCQEDRRHRNKCFGRFGSSFIAAGFSAAEQERFESVKAMMMQRVGVGAWRFMADYEKRCNPESVCHVSDYCARTIIASMSTDLLESDYKMYSSALFHNKFVSNKKQQSHVDTIMKVHQGLLHAEAAEPCDTGAVAARRGVDVADKTKFGVHNCWTFIKKFKKTASLLCRERDFWEGNQCGPSDCDKLCDDSAAKKMAADDQQAFPAYGDRVCLALSLVHLCRGLKAPASTMFLADSCVPRAVATGLVVTQARESLATVLSQPLPKRLAVPMVRRFCGMYLHANEQLLDQVADALVAYTNRKVSTEVV